MPPTTNARTFFMAVSPVRRSNRQGVVNERVIRVKGYRPTPAPSHAESLARAASKRGQGNVWAGYSAAKETPSGMPTPWEEAEGTTPRTDIARCTGVPRGQR